MEITNANVTVAWFGYYKLYYDPQRTITEDEMILLFRKMVVETKARGEALQT